MRWLIKQAFGALISTGLIFVLVFVASAASDEGGILFRDRVGRVLPTIPIASCLGVYLAARRAERRGELRLLGLLGVNPLLKDAAFGLGALVPALAVAVWLLRGGPIEGFFPPSPATVEFQALPNGAGFQSERIGMRWTPGEGLSSIPESAQRLAAISREPAAVVVVLLALGLVLFAARERETLSTRSAQSTKGKGMLSMLFALSIAAATLSAFQLAAAGYVGPWWTIAPACLLLASEAAVRLRPVTSRT